MCIVCRGRFGQSDLLRFQCIDGDIIKYTNSGRSFYMCRECIERRDRKKLIKRLSAICKKEIKITNLESIVYE